VNKDWYVEHYASYYPAIRNWAATPGQDAIAATSLVEAAGLIYKIADPQSGIAGCFECHSTGPVSFTPDGEVRLTEQGVHCESCHGPGAAHAKDPAHARPTNPAKLSAAGLNEFCGRCHRPPAAANAAIDWSFSWNIRHQPVYLSESQCFKKSRGALTCLTCHDPHETAGTAQLAGYNRRCLGCHPKAAAKPANCVDCHMPRVSPQPPLRFSNHWIGIYRGSSKLKPER
jgi:predicted CXXCH cytochrome family protein